MDQVTDQNNGNVAPDPKYDNIQNEESKKYKCHYLDCHFTFLRPSRLERHIRSHTGERPYKCSHPECTKSYTNSSYLKRHMETHNPVKKVYKCTECSLAISSLHNLKRHYRRMHSEEKKLTCKECNKTFNKKYQFIKHQAVHSNVPTIYKCDKCNRSYEKRSKFRQHYREIHERSYPCPVPGCSEVFDKWLLLRKHKKIKHIDYKCDTCDKVFPTKVRLKIHCKIHSDIRSVVSCPYDNCDRVFYSKSNLDYHVRSKHLGKKFYCDICSVGLTTKRNLKKHIQHHYEPKKKNNENKKNKVRRKRKDAGIPRKSILTALVGVNLPHQLEKIIMERETMVNNTAIISGAS